ncbi:hypothetical protein EYF80_040892 [Liparis tanakae]|uniref:Uncharacterized protein n=1 Tax=Liparis tanakae TaxID=230148 RepID=A0A4Z2G705_9TELE|nr:hypothetical protein EYF80_040892 [Liparis tanakae]
MMLMWPMSLSENFHDGYAFSTWQPCEVSDGGCSERHADDTHTTLCTLHAAVPSDGKVEDYSATLSDQRVQSQPMCSGT